MGARSRWSAIDPDEGILVVRSRNGKRQALDMANVADRPIRSGWVRTIHSAQGATCERVMAHLGSFRSNVDAIQTEQAMLAMEAEGRDRLQPLYRDEWEVRKVVAAAKRRSADHGHSWT